MVSNGLIIMNPLRLLRLLVGVILLGVISQAVYYKPVYQPELDKISLQRYIVDENLFNHHINCLLFDGPCDPVGRWMRPRMASYFLSSCLLCTPNQEKETDKFITYLYENHPQLFRTGISKYLDANGISLPANSKFRSQMEKMNVPKVSVSGDSSKKRKTSREDSSTEDQDQEEHQQQQQQDQEEEEEEEEDGLIDKESNRPKKDSKNPELEIRTKVSEEPEEIHDDEDEQEHGAQENHGNTDSEPHSQFQQQSLPNQRKFNVNSRKNKFSSAIMFNPNSNTADATTTSIIGSGSGAQKKPFKADQIIEDDEAEMDYKIYY